MSEHTRPASRHESAVLHAWADAAVLTPVLAPPGSVPLEQVTPGRPGTGPTRVHLACVPDRVVSGWLATSLGEPVTLPGGRLTRGWFDLDDAGRPVPGSLVVVPLLDVAHALYAKSAGVAADPAILDAALEQVAALAETLEREFRRGGDAAAVCAGLARLAPRLLHRDDRGASAVPVDLVGPARPADAVVVSGALWDAAEQGVPPALAHLLAGRPGSRPVSRTDLATVEGLAVLLDPADVPAGAPAADGPAPLPVQVAVTALLRERAPLTTLDTGPTDPRGVLDGLAAALLVERARALVAVGSPADALTGSGPAEGVAGGDLLVVDGDGPSLPAVLADLAAGRWEQAAVKPGDWGQRRHAFTAADRAVADAVARRGAATGARWELADLADDETAADRALADAAAAFGAAQQDALAAEVDESAARDAAAEADAVLAELDADVPPRRAVGRRREWTARRERAAAAVAEAHEGQDAAHARTAAAGAAVQQRFAVRLAGEERLAAVRTAAAAVRARTRPGDTSVVDDDWWAREPAERSRGTAWVDEELHGLRVALHEAAARVVDVAVRVLSPRLRAGLTGDVPRDAAFWAGLGLVHPVLSVRAEELVGLLGELPVDAVGWLAVPGAQRWSPARLAAVLRHARHGVVLGDSGEDEPPGSVLPGALLDHVTARHGLPVGYAPHRLSALRLAESTALVGAAVGGRWTGVPLQG